MISKKHHSHAISIKWKLFAFLMAFVVIILAVIWLFQIYLLDSFYRSEKCSELEEISQTIEACLGDGTVQKVVYGCAVKYDTCIRVFRIGEENTAYEIASADVDANCSLHRFNNTELNELYSKALGNGGIYTVTKEKTADQGLLFDGKIIRDGRIFDIINTGKKSISMVYSSIASAANGDKYIIMLDAELTPVDATVATLKTQFVWITAVLIVVAFLLAFLISRNISRPISEMSRQAKKLACGDYEVNFGGREFGEIQELANSLNYAASELSKVEHLQQELVANVSHDLRTPLTMIKGYGEMMRDIPGENTPENAQVIADEATRLGELVTDMLDISKIRAGAIKMSPQVFDLTETIRDVMRRYDRLIKVEGYDITFVAEESVKVYADKAMILQVIYNLINNAVNYVEKDKCVWVSQHVSDDGSRVRIEVSDKGEGIEPDQISLVWDRYYKVDSVHKRAVVGTGLGLSIVKGILELHHARYGVQSAVGHGSTFWFELSTETGDGNNKDIQEGDVE